MDFENITLKVESSDNPWDVQSLYEFQYFNCPCCTYKDKEKQIFVNHAKRLHPESIKMFFSIKDESLKDVKQLLTFHQIGNHCDIIKLEQNFDRNDTQSNEEDNTIYINEQSVDVKDEFIEDVPEVLDTELDRNNDLCEQSTLSCDVCRIPFVKKKMLNKHIAEVHGIESKGTKDPDFVHCTFCHQKYENMELLRKHQKADHSVMPKELTCEKCDKGFISKKMLNSHIRRIHDLVKNHACEYCGKCFHSKTELTSHLRNIHEKDKKPKNNQRVECDKCNKTLKDKNALLQHKAYFHEDRTKLPLKCDTCQLGFMKNDDLKKHQKVHDPNKSRDYQCDQCVKSFYNMSALNFHKKNCHSEEECPQCEICKKTFSHKSTLKKHIDMVHHKKLNHTCHICGLGTTTPFVLKQHIEQVHEKKKHAKCETCGMEFFKKCTLQRHILQVHEGVKRYHCDTCGKGFFTNSNFQLHIKTHLGEKPYARSHLNK